MKQHYGAACFRLIILSAALCMKGHAQQPAIPKGPDQIASWVVEQVWNRGDLRLIEQMYAPGALFHYRGQDFLLTREFGAQIV